MCLLVALVHRSECSDLIFRDVCSNFVTDHVVRNFLLAFLAKRLGMLSRFGFVRHQCMDSTALASRQ